MNKEPTMIFGTATVPEKPLEGAQLPTSVETAIAYRRQLTGICQTSDKLPATPAVNDVWKITGDVTNPFNYYVIWNGSVWVETIAPGLPSNPSVEDIVANLNKLTAEILSEVEEAKDNAPVSPEVEKAIDVATGVHLPTNAVVRKSLPLYSGCLKYFPDALVAVAELSRIGNDQHNPGQPLRWDRSKSGDELDALSRHLLDAGTFDTDGIRHSAKVAWRALANLQKEIEGNRAK